MSSFVAVAPTATLAATPALDASPLMIQRESLDDKVYIRLHSLIVDGEFTPGQRLDLDELAQAMGISRTPLVNALKRLNQEGLLDWVHRRGIYIKSLDARELVHLFEFREHLEPWAARLAAKRISRDEAVAMRRPWEDMRGLPLARETEKQFVAHDRAFHWRLVELAENPYLSAAMARINMMACLYLHGSPREWKETIPEHLAILDALERHDEEGAAAAMFRHINQSTSALRREMRAQE